MDQELIGWVLVFAGVADLIVAFTIVRPRLGEEQRRVVVPLVAASGGLMVSLGGCFLGGVF